MSYKEHQVYTQASPVALPPLYTQRGQKEERNPDLVISTGRLRRRGVAAASYEVFVCVVFLRPDGGFSFPPWPWRSAANVKPKIMAFLGDSFPSPPSPIESVHSEVFKIRPAGSCYQTMGWRQRKVSWSRGNLRGPDTPTSRQTLLSIQQTAEGKQGE